LFHCTPHPGLGTVVVRHVQVDLATCSTSAYSAPKSSGGPTVRVTKDSQSIVFKGKVVLKIHENHKGFPAGSPGPILLEGTSPDRRWILYAIDPQGSASLAADGLTLMAIRATGGRSYPVASGLLYDDYRGWCDGKLAITTGGDRYAAHHKSLFVTEPPLWHARRIVLAHGFAFGSLACQGNGIVVQATRDALTMQPHWSLWGFGLEGGMDVVDSPPQGTSDESPHALGSTIYFVRSGWLYAIRARNVIGPLLRLPATDGYYGHTAWPYSVRR
jgi:hypothetical protein